MNRRERVIRAIEFDGPDRIPTYHYFYPEVLLRHGEWVEKMTRKFASDFGFGYLNTKYEWILGRKRRYIDEWGCTWFKKKRGLEGQVKGHPLSEWERLGTYRFPILLDLKEGYVLGSGGNLFERMQWLRGYRNLMVDLISERREMFVLRDKIVEYNIDLIDRSLESGVDGMIFSDDWGTQSRLMINPALWRKIFKPAYYRMFKDVHKGGAHVFFHSDGYIMDIIPDLIEIGVDVLTEIQLEVNGIDELGQRFGGKVCFEGGLDEQRILPWENTEKVMEHTKDAIKTLGCYDGGHIAGAAIGPDVPISNAEAVYEVIKKYGRYPKRIDLIERA